MHNSLTTPKGHPNKHVRQSDPEPGLGSKASSCEVTVLTSVPGWEIDKQTNKL